MAAEAKTWRLISRGRWPEGYEIVQRHKGVMWSADRLCEIEGFDPLVMRVSTEDFDIYDDEGPGDYLLLPAEQAKRWRAAVKDQGGKTREIMIALGHPAGEPARLDDYTARHD